MASISYPTKLSVPGPWLLDAANLQDLDRVIDSCLTRMRERREELFTSAIANRLAALEQQEVSKDYLSKNIDAIRKSVRESYP
jgi:hypothetical protein